MRYEPVERVTLRKTPKEADPTEVRMTLDRALASVRRSATQPRN